MKLRSIVVNHEVFKESKKEKDGTYTLVFNKSCSKKLSKLMKKFKLTEENMTEIFTGILEELKK